MESRFEKTACLIWTLWDGFQTNTPPLPPSHAFFSFQTLMSWLSAAAVMYLFLSAWPTSAQVPLSWHPKWCALPMEQMRDWVWTVSPDGKLRAIAWPSQRWPLENGVGSLLRGWNLGLLENPSLENAYWQNSNLPESVRTMTPFR